MEPIIDNVDVGIAVYRDAGRKKSELAKRESPSEPFPEPSLDENRVCVRSTSQEPLHYVYRGEQFLVKLKQDARSRLTLRIDDRLASLFRLSF